MLPLAMPRLILLTGLHKTGTTSLQATCRANLDRLQAAGFCYPLFPQALGARAENHSHVVGLAFRRTILRVGIRGDEAARAPNHQRAEKLQSLVDALRNTGGRDVLMVAETVSNFTAEELADLHVRLRGLGYDVCAYCCIRTPAQWLHSMVAQRCFGSFGPRLTIRAAIDELLQAGSLVRERLSRIEHEFPDAVFFDFATSVRHPLGPPGRFLQMLGIEASDWQILRENDGGSDAAVRLTSAINAAVGRRTRSPQHLNFYAALERDYPMLRRIPGPKFELREREAAPLAAQLRQENDWLRMRFGDLFGDGEITLRDDPPRLAQVQRSFIQENLADAPDPLGIIVRRFLARH
jgi:hypothetical protein